MQLDSIYGNSSEYMQTLQKSTRYPHFANEKQLFSEFTQYSRTINPSRCFSSMGRIDSTPIPIGIIEYFNRNKDSLFIPCVLDRVFSHCQRYYLFSIDMKKKTCFQFKRQPCRTYINMLS